ncbi:MAG: DUF362 domain-containing protein [Coriobacteriia bacterium]|nr:DUF362 domain-containing protein [Coriobacteriia bacterium]MCL2749587.1 DUF362 domain-containing protein [Coriobacteriia bacterium]
MNDFSTSAVADAKASLVYKTSLRLEAGETHAGKLSKLVEAAGMKTIDFERKFTAIKMHFGEAGNLAYLRPNYAKVLVDLVREQGGWPFLTDSNTLYPGRRKNALEHLDLAYEHGFSPFSTGCHIIIGDGLTGSDEILVPIEGGILLKEARVGRAVMDADILITLTHFKGHMAMGFGGTLKNIGMGCSSRAGKLEMHSASGPVVKAKNCTGCAKCSRFCASDAISYHNKIARIDPDLCTGCGHCISACATDAISTAWDGQNDILDAKVAEYTKAIVSGRPHFHVSLVIDVTPDCDCYETNDVPVVPDVGMFASFDPVALDVACADAVNAQPVIPGSVLAEKLAQSAASTGDSCCGSTPADSQADYFAAVWPRTDWRTTTNHAQKIGLGSCNYQLIEV